MVIDPWYLFYLLVIIKLPKRKDACTSCTTNTVNTNVKCRPLARGWEHYITWTINNYYIFLNVQKKQNTDCKNLLILMCLMLTNCILTDFWCFDLNEILTHYAVSLHLSISAIKWVSEKYDLSGFDTKPPGCSNDLTYVQCALLLQRYHVAS